MIECAQLQYNKMSNWTRKMQLRIALLIQLKLQLQYKKYHALGPLV